MISLSPRPLERTALEVLKILASATVYGYGSPKLAAILVVGARGTNCEAARTVQLGRGKRREPR